eukprot:Sspe_Gene.45780::Locus_22738_Transcript_1_1_Confidence_1.000_Length_744::g.45780::m.45780
MATNIEQFYARSKKDFEELVGKMLKEMQTGSRKDVFFTEKKDDLTVTAVNAFLHAALSEADPEEIKELVKAVDEITTKKIEQQSKEQGKIKSKLKGSTIHVDGGAQDFSKIEMEEFIEKPKEKTLDKNLDELTEASEKAEEMLAKKRQETEALREAMKKEERKVDTSKFAGLKVMKKDEEEDMFGFGGGKKKGKKK